MKLFMNMQWGILHDQMLHLFFRLKKRRHVKLLRGSRKGKRKRPGSSEEEKNWERTMFQRRRKRRRRERERERERGRERPLPLRLWRSQRDLAQY